MAFGLGPLPGVLAIAIHTTGALGKLFAEVVENIDMKPVEGVDRHRRAPGSSTIRFARAAAGAVELRLSYALLRFEINVRGAAVMGFVGAGGIGQDLIEAIRKFYYTDVSAILLLIIATVMVDRPASPSACGTRLIGTGAHGHERRAARRCAGGPRRPRAGAIRRRSGRLAAARLAPSVMLVAMIGAARGAARLSACWRLGFLAGAADRRPRPARRFRAA